LRQPLSNNGEETKTLNFCEKARNFTQEMKHGNKGFSGKAAIISVGNMAARTETKEIDRSLNAFIEKL
jgi:hypothetical protein